MSYMCETMEFYGPPLVSQINTSPTTYLYSLNHTTGKPIPFVHSPPSIINVIMIRLLAKSITIISVK